MKGDCIPTVLLDDPPPNALPNCAAPVLNALLDVEPKGDLADALTAETPPKDDCVPPKAGVGVVGTATPPEEPTGDLAGLKVPP